MPVVAGIYHGRGVAIKIFVADVSPDGSTREELAINCAVNHPNLTKVLALVVDPRKSDRTQQDTLQPTASGGQLTDVEDTAAAESIIGMVLELVDGKPLAGRPTSEHLLRCK